MKRLFFSYIFHNPFFSFESIYAPFTNIHIITIHTYHSF